MCLRDDKQQNKAEDKEIHLSTALRFYRFFWASLFF